MKMLSLCIVILAALVGYKFAQSEIKDDDSILNQTYIYSIGIGCSIVIAVVFLWEMGAI